ncbi:MAG: hypothetical protein A2X94_16310 [Bdellovibrionales bacterium GWB1_55_8]|nr:MAG: hypothetical protein A2X94_16310 [Bdellovibrionales bacterium GWB1_55_8]
MTNPWKLLRQAIVGIFYRGPFVWEIDETEGDPSTKIKQLNEGNFLDHIFFPGISTSVSGNRFKVTRWGIGRLPMSGNSFVHVLIGTVKKSESKMVIRAYFRLNVIVFAFTTFWLGSVYLISGVIGASVIRAIIYGRNDNKVVNLLVAVLFPILGTLMLLLFRGMAKPNEDEILAGLKGKFGEPKQAP